MDQRKSIILFFLLICMSCLQAAQPQETENTPYPKETAVKPSPAAERIDAISQATPSYRQRTGAEPFHRILDVEEDDRQPVPSQYHLPEKPDRKTVRLIYAKAVALYNDKNWTEALRHLEAMRKSRHGHPYRNRIGVLTAVCQLNLGQYDQAVFRIKKALGALESIQDHLHYLMAEARFLQGKYAEAQRLYNQLMADDEDSLLYDDALVRSMECDLKRNRTGRVLTRIRDVFKEKKADGLYEDYPRKGDLMWLQALSYRLKKRYGREAKALSLMLVEPTAIRYRQRIKDRIRALAQQGTTYSPAYGPELVNHVSMLLRMWLLDEAIVQVDSACHRISVDKKSIDLKTDQWLRYYKARALRSLQRYQDAWLIFKRLCDETKNTGDERRSLFMEQAAKTMVRKGELKRALALYQDIYSAYPETHTGDTALFMIAWTYSEMEDFRSALHFLDRFRASHSNQGRLRYRTEWFDAWFTYRAKNYHLALKKWESIRKHGKRHPYYRASTYWAGRCFQNLQQTPMARARYTELAEEDAFTYYRMVAAQRLMGLQKLKRAVAGYGPSAAGIKTASILNPESGSMNHGPKDNIRTWKALLWRDPDGPPYSPERLQTGLANHEALLRNAIKNRAVGVMRRMKAISIKFESIFPGLRRAVVWHDLGDKDRAAFELEAFLKKLIDLWKNRRKTSYPMDGETLEAFELRKRQIESLSELDNRFFLDMVDWFNDAGIHTNAYLTVRAFISGKNSKGLDQTTRRKIYYPSHRRAEIGKWARRHNVPDDLVIAVMRTESHFNRFATSDVGAMGLMQIMPHTADRIAEKMGDNSPGGRMMYDPEKNIQFGTWYLGQLLVKFRNQYPLAIASYNGGPHNVSRWMVNNQGLTFDEFIESIPFSQTRHFTKKVLQTIATYRWLYAGEYTTWNLSRPVDPYVRNNINW
jgi:soluble lytic murein transglycosylase